MHARVVTAEFGIPRALVMIVDEKGQHHTHMVYLREWIAPNRENYLLLDECPEISNPDARYAVNMALLEFQEYESPFENPGHAPE